jgi:hypothetical protein
VIPPRAPFQAERYLVELRDRTAGAPPDTPRELAWLWACAALDVRSDSILIPVLVTAEDFPLVETLARRNGEREWHLPPEYFAVRLSRGGCLLIVDSVSQMGGLYPECPRLP